MKLLIMLAVTSLLLFSCSSEDNPVTPVKGSIFIGSSPAGAEIWINGDNTSLVTPNTIKDLTPGNYIVTLRLQNYNDTTFTVDVEAGKLTSVSVSFQPYFGSIFISTNPSGAEIWLEGVNTSRFTPYSLPDLTPGNYTLTLKLQNYYDSTFVVPVIAGQQTSKSITLIQIINTGNIYLSSSPAGAQIWIDGLNTFKTTPDTVKNVDQGVRSVTLKLQDYRDTTLTVTVTAGQTSIVTNVVLVSDISTTLYGPVRIYESYGTSASQPNGLDLSNGMAYTISSPEAYFLDIYYSSTGYLVQSADLYPNLIRKTDFFVSSGTNLFDGVDSPKRNTGTWTTGFGDRENNYVFLYDHDGHYSKLKIVNWGGGSGPGDPAWVDIQWYYNNIQLDNRF